MASFNSITCSKPRLQRQACSEVLGAGLPHMRLRGRIWASHQPETLCPLCESDRLAPAMVVGLNPRGRTMTYLSED